ncbi:hypothetical protein [Blochmannia endosymbiont of Camponotus (Colobopsis) obliquus]|uniref:hypothetical protein n=1 Tax=Blochmannia endosymbiont of Camponotus (Colobopsis) obliquus TaxID=1505597 RepID=UPI000AF9FA8A|nr:hypothetical protein [Blochmannia endosymbiont of Camponotus (Colobopsis) obliquus]
MATNTFLKFRETKSLLVKELIRCRNKLPKSLYYLADASIQDNNGNKIVVRFYCKK